MINAALTLNSYQNINYQSLESFAALNLIFRIPVP